MAVVHVPPSEATEVARSLLQAARELGLDPTTTVKTSSDGIFGFSFIVPDEVEHRAMHTSKDPEPAEAEETPKPRNKGGRPRKTIAPVDETPEAS